MNAIDTYPPRPRHEISGAPTTLRRYRGIVDALRAQPRQGSGRVGRFGSVVAALRPDAVVDLTCFTRSRRGSSRTDATIPSADARSSAMSGRTSHCRGASNWRCGAHLPPASIFGQADPCIARRQDRRGHTSEVPRRSVSRAGGVAGVCRRSVGTGGTCRHRLNQRDEVAPTGGTPPQVMDVPVRDGSTWAKGGFQRNTRFEGRTSSVTRLARQGAIGVPPRCPPRTAPGHSGAHLATHATHRPVTDGSGNTFAMRRPGVRIPATPPPENPAPPAQTLKPGRGFVIVVCPSCACVPPGAPRPRIQPVQARRIGSGSENVEVPIRCGDGLVAHPRLDCSRVNTPCQPQADSGVPKVVNAAAVPGGCPPHRPKDGRPMQGGASRGGQQEVSRLLCLRERVDDRKYAVEPPRRVRRLRTLGRLESCQEIRTGGIRLS